MRRAAAVFLGVAMQALPAFAGETGSVSGVVRDSQGGVLPGVAVKVSGPQMPGGREAHTTGSGSYNFEGLIPGVYRVEAELSGMGTAVREVRVSVDVDAQVDLTLSPTLSEEVTVSAEAPRIDLKSTEVNFNFTRPSPACPWSAATAACSSSCPGCRRTAAPSAPPAAGAARTTPT